MYFSALGRRLAPRKLLTSCLALLTLLLSMPSLALADHYSSQGPEFSQVFHDADLPMLLIDPEAGSIAEANAAAERFYGYTRSELQSMSIQQINTFTPQQVKEERALAASEGRNFFIFRHRLANGDIKTVEVHSRPYRFDGKPLLYSIINDITPGRYQQAELWHYQERLEQMVDAQVQEIEQSRQQQFMYLAIGLLIQAAVILILFRNIRRRRALERQTKKINRALEEKRLQLEAAQRIARVGSWQLSQQHQTMVCSTQMLDILELDTDDPQRIYNQAWLRVHPDDVELVRQQMDKAIAEQGEYEIEHRLLMENGLVKHIHVRGECMDTSEDVVLMGTVQDVTRQHAVTHALTALATEYAPLSGEDFYRAVCQHLSAALGLEYVFVGRLMPNQQAVEVITGCTPEGDMRGFKYSLNGTPCSNVMKSAHSVHACGIQASYPEDALLQDMSIESYIGSSLLDKQGQPIGILVGLGCQPLKQEALAQELLKVFVDRVCAEMQRSLAEQQIEKIDAYREIVLRFSNRFINLSLPEVDQAIIQALQEIGEFIGSDNCYLFAYDFQAGTFSMTHEWCNGSMLSWRDRLQDLPISSMPSWAERHSRGETISIPDVDQMEETFVADIVRERGIKSFIDEPLMNSGECIGFVGVSSSHEKQAFSEETVQLLKLFAGLLTNIRKRRHAEGQLRLSASVFDNADESIMITDTECRIIRVNDAFTRTTGYSEAEVKGLDPIFMNVHHTEPGFMKQVWQRLRAYGAWKGEVWNRHREGERYAVLQKINAFHDEEGELQGYVSLMSDITTLKNQQHQLERIAHFDALTGLPNRTLLADRMQQAIALANRNHTQIAILFIDLDGFKAVNDTHSHSVGDELLVQVSNRMKKVMRDEDTLARIGGDEFVAVLMNLEQTEDSLPVIRRLLNSVADPIHIKELELKVSASVGVAFYPQQENLDADQLLRQADQAMYQAKQAGKNRYQMFDVERDLALRSQNDNLARFRQALDQSELVLHYQPKVNMRTGQVVGCEALIRWQHPEQGLLPPASFLPAIENHPLSVDVGQWVLENALKQILAWREQGLEIPVSVNIDAIHLQRSDFVDTLRTLLAEHPAIRAGDLELEILETTALEDVEHVSAIIEECSRLGVGFALDDFGTGYSSLTYLKRLPAQLLKIDRSFVRDMLVDPDDLAILKGVIQLAGAFRREVIAEGVETEAHFRELLALGCDLGQGYAIARPMPAEEMPAWHEQWQRSHQVDG